MGSKTSLWIKSQSLVETEDGLPTRKGHSGSVDKLFWWSEYLEITTSAMVGRSRWPTRITYVDLFAGPGVLSVEGVRYPGSSLLAANTRKPFDQMICCELNAPLALALEQRLKKCGAASRSIVFQGDCNQLISKVTSAIPEDSLTLAFVDPPGLEASFEMLRNLSDGRNVDLLILVPTEMNAYRNLKTFLLQEHSKLDRVLGPDSAWRERYESIVNQTRPNVSRMIVDVYKSQLRRFLKYGHFGEEVIYFSKMPIYRILFASKHELGVQFWKSATKKTRNRDTLQFE